MRLIHNIPFSPSERELFRRQVFLNITQGMKQVLEAMNDFDEYLEYPEYFVSDNIVKDGGGIAKSQRPRRRRIEGRKKSFAHLPRPPVMQEYLALFLNLPDIGEGQPFPTSYHEPLRLLWSDAAVQEVYKRGPEIALPDK